MNAAQMLPGSWQLLSWTIRRDADDGPSEPFGADPLGLLLYTEDGWMSASIGRRERATLVAGSPRQLEPRLLADAYCSYFHYAGRYRIEGDYVVHSVTQSLNPNFPGTEQWRHMEFRNRQLILRGEEPVGDALRYHELSWQRAGANGRK